MFAQDDARAIGCSIATRGSQAVPTSSPSDYSWFDSRYEMPGPDRAQGPQRTTPIKHHAGIRSPSARDLAQTSPGTPFRYGMAPVLRRPRPVGRQPAGYRRHHSQPLCVLSGASPSHPPTRIFLVCQVLCRLLLLDRADTVAPDSEFWLVNQWFEVAIGHHPLTHKLVASGTVEASFQPLECNSPAFGS